MNTSSPNQSSVLRQPSKCAHTPGPWKCEPDDHFGPGFVITAPGMGNRCPVVRMQSPLGDADETLAADARLIAAAPDLLAALRGLIDALAVHDRGNPDDGGDVVVIQQWQDGALFERASAAIAKATGGA